MSASLDLSPPTDSPSSLFLKSQFRASVQWPPKDTDLIGKVAIVTGSTSGLGLEASHRLLSYGLSGLILTVRSQEKGEQVAAKFKSEFQNTNIQVWSLEMKSYDSIQEFARRAEAELARLDMAILNAGVQSADFFAVPNTGRERLIQVNYLSTALLAILLLPILKSKSPNRAPGRLTIAVEACSALRCEQALSHLFIINLANYVSPDDVVNLADPGLVKDTALQNFAPWIAVAFFYIFKAIFGRPLPVGASTYVDAVAVKGKESHGCFVSNWKISPFAAFVYTPEGEAAREKLWEETMAEFEFVGGQRILNELKE